MLSLSSQDRPISSLSPPAGAASHGASAGTGTLEFGRAGMTDSPGSGRTVVTKAYAQSPLRLLNPRNHGTSSWVYTSTYGGGLLSGDTIDLKVRVCEGATALLATQASTKIYRATADAGPRRSRPSTQLLTAQVDSDGLLALAPDPVVCFAGARFVQQQDIHLHAEASLLLIDWLSAGRHASGERWAFDSYFSRIAIWQDGRKLVHEALRLGDAAEMGLLPERMGRFNVLAVMVLVGKKTQDAARELLAALAQARAERNAQLLVVGSALGESGAILRIGGVAVEQVAEALRQRCRFLIPLLGDDPWSRKW